MVISQTKHSLSTLGFNEHKPLESTLGNMGITFSGKYTEVPRLSASLSRGEPLVT